MRLFNYENKRMEEISDPVQAEALIGAGKAVRLELPKLDELQGKADEIHANYKKEVERIKSSDNPLLQNPDVLRYELDRLDKEYRAQSAEVEEQYKAWRAQQIEESKVRAARAVIKVTDSDRTVAEQFVTRASLKLAAAYDDEKGAIVGEIIEDIAHLSDAEKTAMQSKIGVLLSELESSDKQKLVSAVQDIRNSDLLAIKVAEQLPFSVLTKQRISDAARKSVENHNSAFGGGYIDREFYEKHLK